MKEAFDYEAFCIALDSERLSRQLTWKDVAEESGVHASTLSRMQQGKRPDVDGFTRLLNWSNLKAEAFMLRSGRGKSSTLAQMMALLRADRRLTSESKKTLEHVLRSTYEVLDKKE